MLTAPLPCSPALSFHWPYLPFPLDTCKQTRPHGQCRWTLECRRRRHSRRCSRCSHLHSSHSHTHSHSPRCGWCRCLHSDRHWVVAGTHPHPLCRTVLLKGKNLWLGAPNLKWLVPSQPQYTSPSYDLPEIKPNRAHSRPGVLLNFKAVLSHPNCIYSRKLISRWTKKLSLLETLDNMRTVYQTEGKNL